MSAGRGLWPDCDRDDATGVPWSKVGPGWELAEYTAGSPAGDMAGPVVKASPVTLYLISPAGVRYPMHTWAARATAAYLIAWSGDKTRALLGLTGSKYEQLTLATGKLTAGQLLKVLTRGVNESTAVYAANGTVLAVSGSNGLELVSNVGGVIRSLPVPNLNPRVGCTPARWWNSTTVLAQCTTNDADAPRLWLVPISGKRPTALTVPAHTAGQDNRIVTALGGRLLIGVVAYNSTQNALPL